MDVLRRIATVCWAPSGQEDQSRVFLCTLLEALGRGTNYAKNVWKSPKKSCYFIFTPNNIQYICVCMYTHIHVFLETIMWSLRLHQANKVWFVPCSFSSVLVPHPSVSSFPLDHLCPVPLLRSAPNIWGLFTLSWFCVHSMLCNHTGRFGAKTHRWERACPVCLCRSRSWHSV